MFFDFLVNTTVFGLSLFDIFEYFLVYGVIGWIFESCLVSFREKRWVNRGFLFGPFIPIYSFGVICMVLLLKPINDLAPAQITLSFLPEGQQIVDINYKYFLIFLGGAIVCSTLEFVVSLIMEKMFNMRWWDYTDYRFNIQGRACLSIGALWGMMSVVVINFLHPYIIAYPLSFLDKKIMYIIMIVGYILLVVDAIFSGIMASKLSVKVKFLAQLKAEMEVWAERSTKDNAEEVIAKIKSNKSFEEMQIKFNESEKVKAIRDRYNEIISQITNGESRFFKAKPDIELGEDQEIEDELKMAAQKRIKNTQEYKKHNKEAKKEFKSKNDKKTDNT